jgi:stage V sporulation protein R
MSDWDFNFLEEWDDKITELAKSKGLDWYPIVYEVCDYYSMIGHMSYHGMPSHYGHWSYGKSFERTHQMYNMGMEGLPYELIINSKPSIAYLMQENPAYLQLLIMCHCVGHSDFFKNNRMFNNTRADTVVSRFRNAKKRIQEYVEDPTIGIKEVESILDAAHAVNLQTYRHGFHRPSEEELRKKYAKLIKEDETGEYTNFDLYKIPLEPEYDLLKFIVENGSSLPDWKKDIIHIVRDQSQYFIPQIQTKIMNEGWASFWHYTLMHELDLPQEYHIPFLKSHNQVIRPHIGGLNPYHMGFFMFQKIKERYGMEECFIAREVSNDVSFLRQYMTEEDCHDLGLFSFSRKKEHYEIEDISDSDGWKVVKQELLNNVGTNGIPVIYIDDIEDGNVLVLKHEHDGRDLELQYADEVIMHVSDLWGDVVKFHTIVEGESWEI